MLNINDGRKSRYIFTYHAYVKMKPFTITARSSLMQHLLSKHIFPDYSYHLYEYEQEAYYDYSPDAIDAPEDTAPLPPSTAEAEASDIRSYFPETWLWSLTLLPSVLIHVLR